MKRQLKLVKVAMAAAALVAAGHAAAQITMYEHEGFRGRGVTVNEPVWNLNRINFNDRAASVVIDHGRWEVCEYERFEGRCSILRRGQYPSLREIGLSHQISSIRPVDENRREYGPPQAAVVVPPPQVAVVPVPPQREWERRPQEVVYQVPVSSVHAVVGPPNQRCWVERQPVAVQNNQSNVGGALVGGLVGGILGHQVGGGTGRDLATAAGAIGGAVVGNNLANQQGGGYVAGSRDVQRCENVQNATPDYYDVTYNYRGVDHHVQMMTPPGPTIIVNANGEPRL